LPEAAVIVQWQKAGAAYGRLGFDPVDGLKFEGNLSAEISQLPACLVHPLTRLEEMPDPGVPFALRTDHADDALVKELIRFPSLHTLDLAEA
jgi:hypothetical protein